MQKPQPVQPVLSILIQPSLLSGLSADEIADQVLPLIGGALTREFYLLSSLPPLPTELSSPSDTRAMAVRIWSDFSTMVSELQSIVAQMKTLMSSYNFSLMIFVGETCYEYVEDFALGVSSHFLINVMDWDFEDVLND